MHSKEQGQYLRIRFLDKQQLKTQTFPRERREEVRSSGPLNTSQIRQPSRHTSPAL